MSPDNQGWCGGDQPLSPWEGTQLSPSCSWATIDTCHEWIDLHTDSLTEGHFSMVVCEISITSSSASKTAINCPLQTGTT